MTTALMQRSKACFTSNEDEYITPSWLFDELNKRFHFTLDPCTSSDNPLNLPKFYTKQHDGLKQSWANEMVYANPPYGREVGKWVKKAFDSIYMDRFKSKVVVMLLPNRSDTERYHRYILPTKNCHVEPLKGRLKFKYIHSNNSAPFPSIIVVMRPIFFQFPSFT